MPRGSLHCRRHERSPVMQILVVTSRKVNVSKTLNNEQKANSTWIQHAELTWITWTCQPDITLTPSTLRLKRLFTFSQGSNDMCIQDNFLVDIIGFQLLNQLSCRYEKLPWKAIYTANSSVSWWSTKPGRGWMQSFAKRSRPWYIWTNELDATNEAQGSLEKFFKCQWQMAQSGTIWSFKIWEIRT